jgi:hypothetical protein
MIARMLAPACRRINCSSTTKHQSVAGIVDGDRGWSAQAPGGAAF